MRPLKLVLSGLNSFKESQEIDFAELCQGNVFGIFGSTGSGKSTIIDAITLALYGKVERAARNRQGIVNKSMDSASVSFEFELGNGEERKTYRVERKYVAKDETVTCRLARISDVSGNEAIVLAEKSSDVDRRVEEILGLTVADFTRAVVLPQGRFAEFLMLQGKERRKMLERIFGLEEYGEKLTRLVADRLKGAEQTLRENEGKRQSLGNASTEAVDDAKQRVQTGFEEAESMKKNLEEAEKEYKHWQDVRDKQFRLTQAQQRLSKLDQQSEHIKNLASQLERYAAAEKVSPYIRAEAEAQIAKREAEAKLKTKETLVAEARMQEQRRVAELERAEAVREEREEPLRVQLQQFNRAIAIEEKLKPEEDRLRILLTNGKKLSEQVDAEKHALQEKEGQLQALSTKINELQAELGNNSIAPEQRRLLEQATRVENRCSEVNKQVHELEVDKLNRCTIKIREEQQLAKVSHEQNMLEAEANELTLVLAEFDRKAPSVVNKEQLDEARSYMTETHRLSRCLEDEEREQKLVTELNTDIQKLTEQLAKEREQQKKLVARAEDIGNRTKQCKAEINRVEQNNLAVILSRDLKKGLPCPVCGSTEHPKPIVCEESDRLTALQAELGVLEDQSEQTKKQLAETSATIVATNRDLVAKNQQLTEATARLSEIEPIKAQILQQLPMEWQKGIALPDLVEKAQAYMRSLSVNMQKRHEWDKDCNEARQQRTDCLEKLSKKQQEVALTKQALKIQESEIEQLEGRLAQLEEQKVAAELELSHYLNQLRVQNLAPLRHEFQEMDKQVSLLSQKIKKVEIDKNSLQQEIRQSEQQRSSLQRDLAEARTEYRGADNRVAEFRRELNEITSGIDAATLKNKAEQDLKELKDTEITLRKAYEVSRNHHSEAAKELSAAREAHRVAYDTLDKAHKQLGVALDSQGFATSQAAIDALDWGDLVDNWKQEIEHHRKEQQIETRKVAELKSQLAGAIIDEETWTKVVQRAKAIKQEYEKAIEELGMAKEALEDILQRHEKWLKLEEERKEVSKQKGLLSELATLLRGNALVEFMAGEHLDAIASIATTWLDLLTSHRYALEVAPDGGFIIRDDGNGGERRPVHTLSGGETFITSLALALALSSQIQLRGKHHLEFFFLDEGFGTLDPGLLEVVMSCLERMQGQEMSIGLISHVPELRERTQRKVLVTPAELGGQGSRVSTVMG